MPLRSKRSRIMSVSRRPAKSRPRSEEHTSELQSLTNLVCRLLLEKKKLVRSLWREMAVALIHSHTLGRLGGIALTVAKKKWVPFVYRIPVGMMALLARLYSLFDKS